MAHKQCARFVDVFRLAITSYYDPHVPPLLMGGHQTLSPQKKCPAMTRVPATSHFCLSKSIRSFFSLRQILSACLRGADDGGRQMGGGRWGF